MSSDQMRSRFFGRVGNWFDTPICCRTDLSTLHVAGLSIADSMFSWASVNLADKLSTQRPESGSVRINISSSTMSTRGDRIALRIRCECTSAMRMEPEGSTAIPAGKAKLACSGSSPVDVTAIRTGLFRIAATARSRATS